MDHDATPPEPDLDAELQGGASPDRFRQEVADAAAGGSVSLASGEASPGASGPVVLTAGSDLAAAADEVADRLRAAGFDVDGSGSADGATRLRVSRVASTTIPSSETGLQYPGGGDDVVDVELRAAGAGD